MDLHTPRTGGPLMAVELKNNIIIHWRPHGVPLRFTKMLITDLHYIGNDIDEIAGGPHAVVVFTIFAHLAFHPITFYVHEVAKIRQSVVALLSRAPQTTVIIKSGNTAGTKGTRSLPILHWFQLILCGLLLTIFMVNKKIWCYCLCMYIESLETLLLKVYMKMLSFTLPYVIPNMYDWISFLHTF